MDEQKPAAHPSAAPTGDAAGSQTGPPAGQEQAQSSDGPAEAEPQGASADGGTTEGAGGPAGPRPLGVGVVPTGHEPVDAQLRRLGDADHLAVSGHLEVYEDVHRGLRATLTALDRHEQ